MAELRRIPFDSLTLAAVVHEARMLVGGKVQRIVQPEPSTVVLSIYAGGAERHLLLSCDAEFARAHLVSRSPRTGEEPPAFCMALRAQIQGARLADVRQIGFDRILELEFEGALGRRTLIAEIMGKHANLILVDDGGKSLGAAKWVNPSRSSRPITPNRKYERPPFPPRSPIYEEHRGSWKGSEGASTFLFSLLDARGDDDASWLADVVREGTFKPVTVPGAGAYPVSVALLGFKELRTASLSEALEAHFEAAIARSRTDRLRSSLLGQLRRVVLARETALADLAQAADVAARASELQRRAELILAYGPSAPAGASALDAFDFEGNPLRIPLDPEATYLENAERLFEKARRAKARVGEVQDQQARLGSDLKAILAHVAKVEAADDLAALEGLRSEALERRWLHVQAASIGAKPESRFEGHKIRELAAPGGLTVLYGENATSNDFLTQRIAKPNDIWLHVRGSASAHVVVQTHGSPEKVGKEALLFAARVAVRNSASKHSGYVSVDYTLKKYVRKPRGSAPGFASYTHEKTLHVEPN